MSSSGAGVDATFVPSVGMVGCSLRSGGVELLHTREGLASYAERGRTMGIPILHPWANRLRERRFIVAGSEVDLTAAGSLVKEDARGMPIHGLLAASPHWEVFGREAAESGARLAARLDWASHPELLAAFPFPHELEIEVHLEEATLRISTRLRATGELPVPVSFGYHPYFRLPDLPRAEWQVSMPVRRRVLVDDEMIPTGMTEAVDIPPGPLGGRVYDDAFDGLEDGSVFELWGGGRRVAVEFRECYPVAIVWAPAEKELICFEPMTARTNALVSEDDSLRLVPPGSSHTAVFSITATVID